TLHPRVAGSIPARPTKINQCSRVARLAARCCFSSCRNRLRKRVVRPTPCSCHPLTHVVLTCCTTNLAPSPGPKNGFTQRPVSFESPRRCRRARIIDISLLARDNFLRMKFLGIDIGTGGSRAVLIDER